jgi:Flp pilus assembly protein TadD
MAARDTSFAFSAAGEKIAARRRNAALGQASNETCAPCHSRRQALVKDPGLAPGSLLLDQYLPSMIEPGLYHADGQIDGEVFEAGSFAQSAMHRAGVACIDCHEPHSLKLLAEGNALCGQCHRARFYDRAEHHHHSQASAAAQCVNCHMPTKTYMGVHERHDHSLRIPDPSLSQRLGTPDACGRCHADKPPGWAAAAITGWTGKAETPAAGFASAIDATWRGSAATDDLLDALAGVPSGFVQASMLSLLPAEDSPQWRQAVAAAAQSGDGLVRVGAARALRGAESPAALAVAASLLDDPLLAVRVEAARSLIGTPAASITATQNQRLQTVTGELIESELAAADRPESHVNLAAIRLRLDQPKAAEQALRTALRLSPDFVPALVNLADLYRIEHRDAEGEPLLRRAVKISSSAAESAYALGLLLIRQGRRAEALPWLRRAVELSPVGQRYAHVLRIAEGAAAGAADRH